MPVDVVPLLQPGDRPAAGGLVAEDLRPPAEERRLRLGADPAQPLGLLGVQDRGDGHDDGQGGQEQGAGRRNGPGGGRQAGERGELVHAVEVYRRRPGTGNRKACPA